MAKLRKWAAYKSVERPYTRWSKVRKKAFVKSRPGKKVIKFDMGDIVTGFTQFPIHLTLVSKDLGQIRTNAIEASRIAGLKRLETKLGRRGFYLRIRSVPHQMVRENPLAAGAGADRLSTGMKHSFGKIIGTSCQVEKGKILYDLYLPEGEENFGRLVLGQMSKKLPVRTTTQVEYLKAVELTQEQIDSRDAKDAARQKGKSEELAAAATEVATEGSSEDKKEE